MVSTMFECNKKIICFFEFNCRKISTEYKKYLIQAIVDDNVVWG